MYMLGQRKDTTMKTKTYLQKTAQQVIASLPPKCYSVTDHEGVERVIEITAGEMNCRLIGLGVLTPQQIADYLNKSLGVTEKQVKAMVTGSQFGWHCAGADPNNPINN